MENHPDIAPEALWKLAFRLLAPNFPLNFSSHASQLYVGGLPPDLYVAIPLPESGSIIGSYRDSQDVIIIALDVPLPFETTVHAYEAQLSVSEWTRIDGSPSRLGGFGLRTTGEPVRQYGGTYCRSVEGPAIMIRAFPLSDDATDVRLRLCPGSGPCAHPPPPPAAQPLLPELEAPADAELVPRFAGGSDEYASSVAQLVTNLDLPALVSHYARQLEAAGWEPRVTEEDGTHAWSTWIRRSDDAPGGHRILYVSILQHSGLPWRGGAKDLTDRPNIVRLYALDIRSAWKADAAIPSE